MSGFIVQQIDCRYGARVSTEASDRAKSDGGAYPERNVLHSEALSYTKHARAPNQCVSTDDYGLNSSTTASEVEHQEKVCTTQHSLLVKL
jgi:hypothetical protein